MNRSCLCLVSLIICSGYVIGDLELYPDYTRPEIPDEEWNKEQPLHTDFQHYLEDRRLPLYKKELPISPFTNSHRAKQFDPAWSNAVTQNLLKNQDLALRISELAKKLEEPNRRPQYYFKTHGSLREQENRYNVYNNFDDRNINDAHFLPRLRPNFHHLLDNDRFYSDTENEDFNPNDEDIIMEDNRYPPESSLELKESPNDEVEEKLDGPAPAPAASDNHVIVSESSNSEFAYPPSDPRYFESSPAIELNAPETNKNSHNVIPIQIHNRKQDTYQRTATDVRDTGRHQTDNSEVVAVKPENGDNTTGVYIIAIVAGISAAATVGLIAFGIGWYNLQKHIQKTSDVDYPAYGVTGPNKDISPSGDRRLAQSAQMYHYQHQKQQIIAMERAAANERNGSVSEADSDEENEEGDYTVYECPGLAPTGEMEVKNPLFQDDPTPAQTPASKPNEDDARKK